MRYVKLLTNVIYPVIVFTLCVVFIPKLLVYFIPFVIGWIIASISYPLVMVLEKKVKIVPKLSSAIIIVLVISLVGLCGYGIIWMIMKEGEKLIENAPTIYQEIEANLIAKSNQFQVLLEKLPKNIEDQITSELSNINVYISEWISTIGEPTVTAAGNVARNIPAFLIGLIVTFLSSYFLIAQRKDLIDQWKKIVPVTFRKKVEIIWKSIVYVIGGYFRAQFKIMAVVAVILFVGFLIIGVNYGIFLAIIIAFLDMLPFLGTGTVLIPWGIFHIIAGNYKTAIGLLVLYAVTQLVRQLIQPKVLGDTIGLNPMIALLVMYVGYKLSGIGGMLLAVPVVMIGIRLYEAKLFEDFIYSLKELWKAFQKFKKVDKE